MTHYQTLDLPAAASAGEIKGRYLVLAQTRHPDVGGDPTEFAAVTEAYNVLKDADTRRAYDASLSLTHTPCPRCHGMGREWRSFSFTDGAYIRCPTCHGRSHYPKGA